MTAASLHGVVETPIALFVFNRPALTRVVWNAIRAARPRILLIVADGAREDNPADVTACQQTRAIVQDVDWPCSVHRNYAEANLGLKRRVETGLTWVFDRVEQAIVLEDDCVPHPTFFTFCEEMLARYRDDHRVRCVSGNNFCAGTARPPYSYRFSRYPHIWGWASWSRAWRHYDAAMPAWPGWRDGALREFLRDRTAADYWSYVLQKNYEQQSSWDYVWMFSNWVTSGLSITPAVNLVTNIGFGPGGTHTTDERSPFAHMPAVQMPFPLDHPPEVVRDADADALVDDLLFGGSLRRVFWRLRSPGNSKSCASRP